MSSRAPTLLIGLHLAVWASKCDTVPADGNRRCNSVTVNLAYMDGSKPQDERTLVAVDGLVAGVVRGRERSATVCAPVGSRIRAFSLCFDGGHKSETVVATAKPSLQLDLWPARWWPPPRVEAEMKGAHPPVGADVQWRAPRSGDSSWTEPTEATNPGSVCSVESAKLRCLIPPGRWDLRLSAPGYEPVYFFDQAPDGALLALPDVDWKLMRYLVGRVEVAARSGIPPERVRLVVSAGARADGLEVSGSLDADGSFRIGPIATAWSGSVVLTAEADGERLYETAIPFETSGDVVLPDPVLLPEKKSLEIVVVPSLAPSGSRWELRVRYDSKEIVFAASESGRASIPDLWPGSYSLSALDGDDWLCQKTLQLPRVPDLEILECPRGYLRVKGQLRVGGRPAAGSLSYPFVAARPPGPYSSFEFGEDGKLARPLFGMNASSVQTDDRGKFALELHPGNGRFALVMTGNVEHFLQLPIVDSPDEGVTTTILDLPARRLQGRVVDEAGDGIGGIRVEAVAADRDNEWSATMTDERGAFTLAGLGPGPMIVRAAGQWETPPRRRPGAVARISAPIVLDGDTDPAPVVIEAPRAMMFQGALDSGMSPHCCQVAPESRIVRVVSANDPFGPSATTRTTGPEFRVGPIHPETSAVLVAVLEWDRVPTLLESVPIANAVPFHRVSLPPTGGTLVLEGLKTALSRKNRSVTFYVLRDGAFYNVDVQIGWSGLMRGDDAVLRGVSPGLYGLCAIPPKDLPSILQSYDTDDRCRSGTLRPQGELNLAVPAVD